MRHPDFLLLDEPTNHLDMGMLEWLEEYLRSYKGGILLVSHDRYFLDAVATGIIDLENCHIRSFRGGYTRYQQTKAQQDAAYEKAYEKQQEHIKETEEYIREGASLSWTGWSGSKRRSTGNPCAFILRRRKNARTVCWTCSTERRRMESTSFSGT